MEQRLYEGMFLFDANLAGRDWPNLERHVEDVLKKNSAEIVYSERWPDRRLSFEIKGCKKGTYFLTYFNAPSTAIHGLERDCQLSDRILRALFLQEEGVEESLERRRNRQQGDGEDEEGSESASEDSGSSREGRERREGKKAGDRAREEETEEEDRDNDRED